MPLPKGKELGHICEELALSYLLKKGYSLLARNFRTRRGEIDLILKKSDTIVFVEVKGRRTKRFGLPQEAVTPAKQKVIRETALAFLKTENPSYKVRFDVLAITIYPDRSPQIEHIKHAF